MRLLITLVHGTWARNARWTRQGSYLREALSDRLRERGIEEVEFHAFQWSGGNSSSARSRGAARLSAHVASVPLDVKQVIVAHSHGGTVALRACATSETSARLLELICLSTPVLHFRRRSPFLRIVFFLEASFTLSVALSVISITAGLAFSGFITLTLLGLALSAVGYRSATTVLERWLSGTPKRAVFFRIAGDEASGALAAARFAAFICQKAYSWRVFILIASLIGLFTVAMNTRRVHFGESPDAWIVQAAILLAAVVWGLMFSLIPALIASALGFGWDSALAILHAEISAEETPPGAWTVQQFSFADRAAGVQESTLDHSFLYSSPAAADAMASRIVEAISAQDALSAQPKSLAYR